MSRIRAIDPSLWPIKNRGPWRHLYVIQEGGDGPLKIGIAANAFWRLSELQVGNYRQLALRAVFSGDDKRLVRAIERSVHASLSEHALAGEWFDCCLEQALAAIEKGGL